MVEHYSHLIADSRAGFFFSSARVGWQLHASNRLDASAVMVNDHTAFRVDWMPFAGLRESGLGVGGIPHILRDIQVDKKLVFSSREL